LKIQKKIQKSTSPISQCIVYSNLIIQFVRPELLTGAGKFFGVYFREQSSKVKEVEKEEALAFLTSQNIHQ
jgi:hypothetical protein